MSRPDTSGPSFTVLRSRNLVYARYPDVIDMKAVRRVFDAYAAHPDSAPGQRQLIDFAETTAMKPDYLEFMKLMAHKMDTFLPAGTQTLMVYHAPTPVAFEIAEFGRACWDAVDGMSVRILQTEPDALDVLGEPERSFADLLSRADIE